MKKTFFFVIMLLICAGSFAQEKVKGAFLDVGPKYSDFQDTKYSNVAYSGIGVGLAYVRFVSKERINWNYGLDISYGKETPNTFENGKATVVNPTLFVSMDRKVSDQWSVGFRWDIIDVYYRSIEGLDNNGNYYISSSSLFAVAGYERDKLSAKMRVGLLSFMQEGTGFAFSAPQSVQEDGKFDYLDESLSSPLGLKHFGLRSIGSQVALQTEIRYQLKKRISLGYVWELRRLAIVDDYPVTMGSHQLIARFAFSKSFKGNR